MPRPNASAAARGPDEAGDAPVRVDVAVGSTPLDASPAAEPATAEKVSLRIARMIARDVAERRLPAGTMLDPEQEMARRFGVGRPSVREALRLLEAQGLITLRRGIKGGPVVAAPTGADLGQTMTMFLQMRSTPLRQVFEAVAWISGLVAQVAAERVARGEATVDELRHALDQEGRQLEGIQRLAAGIAFHDALHRLAGNEVLQLMVEAVGGIWADRTRMVHSDHWENADVERMYDEHVRMFKAIAAGKGEKAAQLARDHMALQADLDLRRHPEVADAIVDWR